jgi:hypothetical protein
MLELPLVFLNKPSKTLFFSSNGTHYLLEDKRPSNPCASGSFEPSKAKTGWDGLQIKTYAACDPLLQMYAAGAIEGSFLW